MRVKGSIRSGIVLLCLLFPALAAAAPVALFPLQELGAGRNEVNLPFTRALTEHLATSGNEMSSLETIISFMANNRIRTVGHLESFHVSRVRDDLGAAFILLGTISQKKERPQPALGMTLQLVRTSDARTVWSYVGHFSAGDQRRPLGIGEPRSSDDLHPLLLADILAKWPWEIVGEMQRAGSISIDAIDLKPRHVRPGTEITSRVRLRNVWLPGRTPRVFFQTDDQLHAAKISADGSTLEATWVAGEKDGRVPVTLIFEWPLYGRSETALLGTYLIDGTPPLLELDLRGIQVHEGNPVFRDELVIIPRLLVRKPLERWRLSFHDAAGGLIGADDGEGSLPERFIWQGRTALGSTAGDGSYTVVLEAWDKAGNSAKASRDVEMKRSAPGVELLVEKNGSEMQVDLEHDGKVPLAYWRMEMWTKEGKILTQTEGERMPATIDIELPPTGDQEIQGFLVMQDVLGNRVRRNVEDLLPKIKPQKAEQAEKKKSISETWVEEF